MKVYFVRHGETQANATNSDQDESGSLNEDGKKQARFLARRLSKLEIDCILSSSYERTRETAEIINLELKKEIKLSDLLIELKVPSELVGRAKDDPEAIEIRKIWRENYGNPNWHYSDEENFFDRKNRVLKFIHYLSSLNKENILIVTHGSFLRMLACVMIFGGDLTMEESRKLVSFLQVSNTGISICEYLDGKWKLITWNDLAYLAE